MEWVWRGYDLVTNADFGLVEEDAYLRFIQKIGTPGRIRT